MNKVKNTGLVLCGLADSGENMLTLYTCVRNQRDQRWCVTAAEV